ncbi:MAG: hypothetical protein ACW98I_20360 [Candidatus Hodarchaeales archaeon]|jgi:hypothetical protein
MRKKLLIVFFLASTLVLVPIGMAYAKKPLIGDMELDFTFGAWPEEPVWVGTIDIEGYGVFGMRFFHLTPFRDYSQVSPFEETFEIYDLETEVVVLGGPDIGRTILANKPPEPVKYVMNGEIDVATWPFEMWLGRNVHMCGIITWQIFETPDGPVVAPATAPGIFRIN